MPWLSNVLGYSRACQLPSSAAGASSSHANSGTPCYVQASRPASFPSDVLHSSSNGHVEAHSLDPGNGFQSGDPAGDFDSSYEPILGGASGMHMLLAAQFLPALESVNICTEHAGQDLSLMGASHWCVLWLCTDMYGPVGMGHLCRIPMSADNRYIACLRAKEWPLRALCNR